MVGVVIITGPCGVGKSSVAFECMELLEEAGVAAAMVDAELAYFHPKPAGDAHGYAVAEAGLRALWTVYQGQGIARLLLGRVVGNAEQLSLVERAVPNADIQVFRLVAAPETIRRRIEKREIGSGLDRHVQRGEEIARSTLGEPIDAERPVVLIARELLVLAGWLPARA